MTMEKKYLPKRFLIAGFLYLVPIILVPLLTSLATETGSIEAQLVALSASVSLYKTQFIAATFIAPLISYILLLLGFGIPTQRNFPILEKFGMVALTVYITLVTLAYTSQYFIFPGLLAAEKMDWAVMFYFNMNSSIPYYLNQLGYTFFGIAAGALTLKLLFESSMLRLVAVFFWLSALFQFVAIYGVYKQDPFLMSSTILSGILTVPAVILLIVLGIQMAHQNGQQ